MEARLANILAQLKEEQKYRQLPKGSDKVDFSSNDYLGLAHSPEFQEEIKHNLESGPPMPSGSTGSRLLSGNHPFYEEVETSIADFHNAEAALLFNSGYDANLGLMSTLPGRKDTILYDQLVHASIRDGIRLSMAKAWPFDHNDLDSLKKKLRQAQGEVFVVVESVYSMDGDQAPLSDLAALCREHGCHLVVDEAHATGVFGENGEGLVQARGLEDAVFARVHTFGKALGCHGAVVLGSQTLREYLINFCRPFIYTTALPPHSVIAIWTAYQLFPEMPEVRAHLFQLSALLNTTTEGPIHCFVIPGNDKVREVANRIQEHGYDVRPILHPTVPQGQERIRICLHGFNTIEQVQKLQQLIDQTKATGT